MDSITFLEYVISWQGWRWILARCGLMLWSRALWSIGVLFTTTALSLLHSWHCYAEILSQMHGNPGKLLPCTFFLMKQIQVESNYNVLLWQHPRPLPHRCFSPNPHQPTITQTPVACLKAILYLCQHWCKVLWFVCTPNRSWLSLYSVLLCTDSVLLFLTHVFSLLYDSLDLFAPRIASIVFLAFAFFLTVFLDHFLDFIYNSLPSFIINTPTLQLPTSNSTLQHIWCVFTFLNDPKLHNSTNCCLLAELHSGTLSVLVTDSFYMKDNCNCSAITLTVYPCEIKATHILYELHKTTTIAAASLNFPFWSPHIKYKRLNLHYFYFFLQFCKASMRKALCKKLHLI